MNNRRSAGAIFYLASAVLSSAWYLTAAITAHSRPDVESERDALQGAGTFLPVMSLLCMLMGVLELLQSSLDERREREGSAE